ncbi:MAG: FAD-dependent oxidoreductase [Calditerrivibrio sp.]|nr:FAD-dependent oxidoreductase [Calditerrivibrio sp.]
MKRLYPIYINKLSPCYSKDHLGNNGCPAKNDIPRFLYLVSLKRFEEAFYILKETNPFSAGCGRFCDHPCEKACNRAKFDYPVDIKSLERFVADWGYSKGLKPKNIKSPNGKQVAIIGSGPAGLSCGYFLAKEGYRIDIFERHAVAGGMLSEGIPAYRYPKNIFQKELDYIKETGVNIYLNRNIDRNSFLNLSEEYDAVIVATGAQKPGIMNIPGETLDGVINGIEFLREVNTGDIGTLGVMKGESIGVIGGGYTAFDVARSGVRLGLKSTIVYRRTVSEMTAHPGEVKECEEEGIKFEFLMQPIKIEKENNKLKLICQVMKLGPVDETGRSRPIPIKGKTKDFYFDKIILAVGDKPDLEFVGDRFVNEFPKLSCHDIPERDRNKIFISGDAAMGSSELVGMVVRAVGSAQRTVLAVREFLGEDVKHLHEKNIAFYNDLNTKYFQKRFRYVEEKLSAKERVKGFDEIISTMDEDTAVYFASRCFYCGICVQCDWCYFYSDGSIVKLSKQWDKAVDVYFYKFDVKKLSGSTFKSVEACPRSALSVVSEDSNLKDLIGIQYEKFDKESL